jgi:tetrahydromethanopterin S-methyltransferase subunit C
MTVKVEVKEGGTPHTAILTVGLVGGLVGIYLTYLNVLTGTYWFSVFGGIGALLAIYWGSHAIKILASYGLGTGVPSAGMIALGSGLVAMLFATRVELFGGIAVPIVTLVVAAVIGAISGVIANSILKMHIPVMVRSLTELAASGSLILLGFSAMATGRFTFSALASADVTFFGMVITNYSASLIGGSIIALIFILGGIAIQHPFNACLGPSWEQDRMLMLSAECGFLSMIPIAVVSFAFISFEAAIISVIVSLVGWLYTFNQYIVLSKRDAAAWLDSKPIVEPSGD